MNIPFFNLSRQYDELGPDVEKNIIEVARSTQYVEGTATKEFEQEIGEYLDVKHAVSCGNGTDALRIALQAAGVREGDEVITTPFTFFATAEAISQTGATPVFADILEETLNIDPDDIGRKVTERTKAILPVHIFGLPAEMNRIMDIAQKKNIAVIEDACQAIGSAYHGKKAGTMGTAGCFSFYPTKNLGAFGDGGLITTDDDEIATTCRALKSHGAGKTGALAYHHLTGNLPEELNRMTEQGDELYDPCKYYNYIIGGNSRLDSIQAAVLSAKLGKLESYNERRNQIARKYTKHFAKLPMVIPQKDCEGFWNCRHQYAILVEEKDDFVKHMSKAGIGTGAFYPVPLHLQRSYAGLGYSAGSLPVAESVCKRSVCLPVFPELTEEETDYIVETVKRFYD